MSEKPSGATKKATLVTVDRDLLRWGKENIKNFSGFVEKSLISFSSSFNSGSL